MFKSTRKKINLEDFFTVEYMEQDTSCWTPDCSLPVCKRLESRPIWRRVAFRNIRQTVLRAAETHERRLVCRFNCGTVHRSEVTTSFLHSTKHEHRDFTSFRGEEPCKLPQRCHTWFAFRWCLFRILAAIQIILRLYVVFLSLKDNCRTAPLMRLW